ncbi:hypothetical protein EYZ11_013291 [Aspergillus tanneri]|uniref:Uncharacterized protein n=1 Tax=Aspergillus tanneri TaxID=1220188 RepID=A0A4S3IYJ4_9EURO|nr:hypothetical protein EYZ11_013291 [Aspergillus tanneri]
MATDIPRPKDAKSSQISRFCKIQGCWTVVEETQKRLDKPEELERLLENKTWASQDALAQRYITENIQQSDMTTVRDYRSSGEIWTYLMEKYEKATKYDAMVLLQRITAWRKDPKVDLEASLQELEQWNADLYEISNKKHKFDEEMVLTMFLNGLPQEYGFIRDALVANATMERRLVLSRLQQNEQELSTNNEEILDESANRV